MNYLFTMADMEESATADFGRGRDKAKRKKRGAGFYAAAGGAGLAGAGGIAAGVRYGGAELALRKAKKNMRRPYVGASDDLARGGAKGQLKSDWESVKRTGSKIKNYDYKGAPKRVWDSVASSPKRGWESAKRAGSKLTTSSGKGGFGGIKARLGNVYGSGKVGQAALGLSALGGVGAAGYGAYRGYKAVTGRKKKK